MTPAASLAPRAPADEGWTPFHWMLAGMVLTYVWRVQDLFPVLATLQVTPLVSLAALGLWATGPWPRHLPRLRHPVMAWGLVILGLAVLSVPGGVYPGHTFRFLVEDHVKTVLFAVLLLCSVRSVRDVERMVMVHVAGATLYCLLILRRFEVQADGRLGGLVYYDANDLAMLLVCTFPMVVYLVRPGTRRWVQGAGAAALGLFVVTIVQTGSRGGFLGLVAVFGVLLVGFHAVPRARRVGVAGAVALLLVVGAGERYWETMGTLLNPSEDYNWSGNSESGRMEVWKRGVGYMVQHPLLGVGASAFGAAEGMISSLASRQELGEGMKWSAAHNSFVQVGAELGFPGLFAFLLMLAAGLRTTRRLGSARGRGGGVPPGAALAQALTATLVGYCVSGFFLSQAYSAYLYTVLALIAALAAVAQTAPATAAEGAGPVRARPLGRGGLVVGPPAGRGGLATRG